ncbi:MAG: cytochrome C oxidase subunit IV family protein [Bacteroidetes bacterium]|nr:cytochrome C oxidase subunit IV family protein [Bacteroidota bacterium]MCW5896973.1 cytochrome C oxidase subunit IV family protein [Bacteroidota bacterium]
MDTAHADDVKKTVRTYILVFVALMGLTVITVAISYLHLSVAAAITVALIVATVKASLVAMYFMHLVSERKAIYWTLALTAFFFILLMFLPIFSDQDSTRIFH